MKWTGKIHIIIVTLIFIAKIDAQNKEIKFSHLTRNDGLSLNVITSLTQDSRGFLWFGTYNGLNRFDGYNFKVFLPEVSNLKSISHHAVFSMYEDRKGNLWIGTVDGLNRYNPKTEDFYRYRNNPADTNSISLNYIRSIFEDKSGTLWIGTTDGLNKYNREKDNFTVSRKVSNILRPDHQNTVSSITQDADGNLWLGTWNSSALTCIKKDGKFSYLDLPVSKNPIQSTFQNIQIVFVDRKNNLWIARFSQGLYKYNIKTGKFTHYFNDRKDPASLSNDYVNTIFQDRFDNIWIGTNQGLNKYIPEKDNFERIMHDPDKSSSIIDNSILSIDEDNTGILWVGTTEGVSYFLQIDNKFTFIQKSNNNNSLNQLSNYHINSLSIDKKQHIWAGTEEGLNEIIPDFNSINSKKTSTYLSGKVIQYLNDPKHKNGLRVNYIWAVLCDHLGNVWVGTNGGGLDCYNTSNGKFTSYKYSDSDPESISNDGVVALYEDSKGNLWAGTWWGFNVFDRERNSFTRYTDKFIKSNTVGAIYEDSDGIIWFGSDGGGLCKLDPFTHIFTNYLKDSANTNTISGNRVITIFESRDKLMWFGTTDGLNSYDRKSGRFGNYSKENGLISNSINNIQEDTKGNLWIGTDEGLSKFDRKTGIFYNYGKRSGVDGIAFNPNASIKLKNNDLLFGCRNGLLFFNPDSIQVEKLISPVSLIDLKIFNQSVPISQDGFLKESITSAAKINIPSGYNVITIEYTLLDFFEPKKNEFSYKLSGFDDNWNEVGNRNSATYTNLPPGEYTFRIRGSNNKGIKKTKETSIRIMIEPSLTQTLWFKISIALSLLILTVGTFRFRTRVIQNRNKNLEKKVSERTQDLDQTINKLNLEITERKKAEEQVKLSLKEKDILIKDKDHLLEEKEGLLNEKVSLLNEKEVLLKEIHHRVKNNLQVISSLLYLNSKKIKDTEALNMFMDSQNRVKSIALIHERLYKSADLGKIDFKEYVQHLTMDLFRSYAVNQNAIKLDMHINNIFINIDFAVPCGLILNELISNSLKYAFPGYTEENREGIIKIHFNRNGNNELVLLLSDNGVGMPQGINEKKKESLGLQLVDTLVAQLNGTLNIDVNSGTAYTIKFNSEGI